jgi:hypothetical protein
VSITGFDIHDAFGEDFDFQGRYDEGDRFCILKASGGYGFRSNTTKGQAVNARKAGLLVGFYHFMFEPDSVGHGGADWLREADNFIGAVEAAGAQPGDTLWLDVEAWGQTVGFYGNVSDWVVNFCDYVGNHFHTVCGIYCATWYLVPTGMVFDNRLTKYPLWFASWQDEQPSGVYLLPWANMVMWQFDATGLDKDRFFGSVEDFKAMGIPTKVDTAGNNILTGILPDGRPYVQVVFAGKTPRVDGADVQDLGITVESATKPGQLLDQSVQHNAFGGWRERK